MQAASAGATRARHTTSSSSVNAIFWGTISCNYRNGVWGTGVWDLVSALPSQFNERHNSVHCDCCPGAEVMGSPPTAPADPYSMRCVSALHEVHAAIRIPTNGATTGHYHCLCLCDCPACWSHNPLRISASRAHRRSAPSTGEGSARRKFASIPRLQTPHPHL